ncbi:MAG: hypothetical protein JSV80_04330, partial [Acidobacteriota bacterium]
MLRRVVILSAAAAGVLAFSVTFTSWAQSPRWTRLDKIELDIQRPDGCPIEFLDGTYVQRPELPAQIHPRLRQTARNLLTYRVRARNSSERRIELIQLEWTAYDENGEALRSRRTTHRWSSSLRPGRRFSDES